MEQFEYREKLKDRTKNIALRIIKMYQSLPKTEEARIIGKQILRSSTSVAANYPLPAELDLKLSFIVK